MAKQTFFAGRVVDERGSRDTFFGGAAIEENEAAAPASPDVVPSAVLRMGWYSPLGDLVTGGLIE